MQLGNPAQVQGRSGMSDWGGAARPRQARPRSHERGRPRAGRLLR
jgi:hypothetical protein